MSDSNFSLVGKPAWAREDDRAKQLGETQVHPGDAHECGCARREHTQLVLWQKQVEL